MQRGDHAAPGQYLYRLTAVPDQAAGLFVVD